MSIDINKINSISTPPPGKIMLTGRHSSDMKKLKSAFSGPDTSNGSNDGLSPIVQFIYGDPVKNSPGLYTGKQRILPNAKHCGGLKIRDLGGPASLSETTEESSPEELQFEVWNKNDMHCSFHSIRKGSPGIGFCIGNRDDGTAIILADDYQYLLGKIVNHGPKGEEDFGNQLYWVKIMQATNTDSKSRLELEGLKNSGAAFFNCSGSSSVSGSGSNYNDIICVENLSEWGGNTHTLPEGAIVVVSRVPIAPTSDSPYNVKYIMESGRVAGIPGIVVCKGPKGENDFTDNRQWVQLLDLYASCDPTTPWSEAMAPEVADPCAPDSKIKSVVAAFNFGNSTSKKHEQPGKRVLLTPIDTAINQGIRWACEFIDPTDNGQECASSSSSDSSSSGSSDTSGSSSEDGDLYTCYASFVSVYDKDLHAWSSPENIRTIDDSIVFGCKRVRDLVSTWTADGAECRYIIEVPFGPRGPECDDENCNLSNAEAVPTPFPPAFTPPCGETSTSGGGTSGSGGGTSGSCDCPVSTNLFLRGCRLSMTVTVGSKTSTSSIDLSGCSGGSGGSGGGSGTTEGCVMLGSPAVGTWTVSEPYGVLVGAGTATVAADGHFVVVGGSGDGITGYMFVEGTTVRFYDESCNLTFERDDAANNSNFYYTAGASFWCRGGGCPT